MYIAPTLGMRSDVHFPQLHRKFWYMDVPQLPPKKWMFNNDEDFIQERRKQ